MKDGVVGGEIEEDEPVEEDGSVEAEFVGDEDAVERAEPQEDNKAAEEELIEDSELGAEGDERELRENAIAGEEAAGEETAREEPAEDGSEEGAGELVGERAGGELGGHELLEEGREGPVGEEDSMEADMVEDGVAKDKGDAEAKELGPRRRKTLRAPGPPQTTLESPVHAMVHPMLPSMAPCDSTLPQQHSRAYSTPLSRRPCAEQWAVHRRGVMWSETSGVPPDRARPPVPSVQQPT